MIRILVTTVFALVFNSLQAQFRLVGTGTWSAVNDTTWQATITFQPDLTGLGYLPTQIVDTFRVFTPTEQRYRIDSIGGATFSSAFLRIVRILPTTTAPSGQVMVYNPDGRSTVPQFPFGTTGSTSQIQAAVVTWNARQATGGGGGPGGTTELADGTTILGDGTAPDPFRVDTNLLSTQHYTDSLHAAQQSELDAIDDSLAVVATRLDTLVQGQGGIDTLPIWTAPRRLGNSALVQAANRLTLGGQRVLRLGNLTDAQRPSALEGDLYYNTTGGGLEWVGPSSTRYYVPRTQVAGGAFTENHILFANASNNLITSSNLQYISSTTVLSAPLIRAGTTSSLFQSLYTPRLGVVYNSSTNRAGIVVTDNQAQPVTNSGINSFVSTGDVRPAIHAVNAISTGALNNAITGYAVSAAGLGGYFAQIGKQATGNTTYTERNVGMQVYGRFQVSGAPPFPPTYYSGDIVGHSFYLQVFHDTLTFNRVIDYESLPAILRSTSTVQERTALLIDWGAESNNSVVLHKYGVRQTRPGLNNIFAGNLKIGANTKAARALDVAGGLRVLPDSLQNNTTRLAGWNASGDATRLVLGQNLAIATGAGSTPDTLNASFSIPEKRFISLWRDLVEHDSLDATPRRLHFPTLATSQGSWTRTDSTVQLVPGKYLISYTVNFRAVAIGGTPIGGHYLYPVLGASILGFMGDQRTFTDDLNALYTSSYTSFVNVESTVDLSLQHYVAGATIYGDVTLLKTLITIQEQ